MSVDIAELLAEQLKEEQRSHRIGDLEEAEVFKKLENTLKNMHLYLNGEMPSYTEQKIRMFSNETEDEPWVEREAVKRRRMGSPEEGEHSARS